MKSQPSGIELNFCGVSGFRVMKTPPSPTGEVYCKRCKWFAAADACLYPSACDHDWEASERKVEQHG